jgi:hypothetical protein
MSTLNVTNVNATNVKVTNIQNSSGTTALTIDESGRIGNPNQPAISLNGLYNGRVDWPAGQQVMVSSVVYNQFSRGGMSWNGTTGRITVPVAGYYYFSGYFYVQIAGNANGRFVVQVNGSNRIVWQTGNSTDGIVTASVLLNMSANDYVTILPDAFDLPSTYMGGDHSRFQMFLIG